MTEPNVTWQQLAQGVERPDGSVHRLVVERVRAHLLELEDANFHFDSAVMMARPRRTVSADEGGDSTGIAVIAGALRFAEQHPDKRILLAGHTDKVGSRSYNETLSADRATNVLAMLTGDRDGWAAACQARHTVEDWQRILAWVHDAHGWECHPGEIDDDFGPRSQAARERFRARYNEEFEASIAVRGRQHEDDWRAYFDLYDRSLAQLMGVEVAALPDLRGGLDLLDPPTLACGEQWPKEGRHDENLASEVNRRVELLFFDAGEIPDFGGETPVGATLYGDDRRFPTRRISIAGSAYLELQVVDLGGNPMPGAAVELDLPHGLTRTAQLDARGMLRLDEVPPGECALRFPEIEQAFEPATVTTGQTTRVVVQRRSILVKAETAFVSGGARQLRARPVEEAIVELVDQGRSVQLGDDDDAMPLDVTDLADGDYTLRVTPREAEQAAQAAGPGLEPDAGVEVAYRRADVTLTLAGGELTAAIPADPALGHCGVRSFAATRVELDLEPEWLQSSNHRPRGGATIDMVVIAHSGAASIGPTLEAYLSPAGAGSSAHYVIDTDGTVVKMVRDADAAVHSRYARWAGSLGVLERSIAIELVHAANAPPTAQIDALVALLQALVATYGIPDHHVVGLEDVATAKTDPVLVGRKAGDPGPDFDWALLERQNLGLRLSQPDPNATTMYDGAFRGGGGRVDENASAAAITELQDDLRAIGYSLNASGSYDKYTRAAVRQFILHFAKHGRARALGSKEQLGREVSLTTAREIKKCTPW